ncbi:MAG TPA: endolytic transglycosylase MltG [Ilumatobacteraceae bacterium]|nr:endolytic transglycosylase MltG [Ilumatobacteraceae bacterium]
MTRHAPTLEEQPWRADPWDAPELTDALVVERVRRSHRSIKWFTYFLCFVVVAGVIVAGSVGLWYLRQVNPPGDPGAVEVFKVLPNDTVESVSVRLQDRGLINNARVFRYYVDHNGGLELIPGDYELRPRDHIGNVMRVLRTPPSLTYTDVTFPEGFTLEKISQRLSAKLPRLDPQAFMTAVTDGSIRSPLEPEGVTSLEGLLFPDTYRISADETPSHIAQRMIDLMDLVVRQEDVAEKGAAFMRTPYDMLIIASMIEKEAKVDEDRPKIARVILNRLALGMPLQIDATLLYGQPPGASPTALAQVDTPYNTYLHTGLPPTPIANPGRASIEAAVNPAPDPSQGDPICVALPDPRNCHYLFYVVADEDGRHAFAATAEQHELNVQHARDLGLLG